MDPGAQAFWRILSVIVILTVAGFEGFLKWRRIKHPAPVKGKRSLKKSDPRTTVYVGLFIVVGIVILLTIYAVSKIPI